MASVALYIVLETSGKPLGLARLTDREMVLDAARVAISHARQKAKSAGDVDPVLGQIQRAEAAQLAESLALVVPGLATASSVQ